MANEYVPLNSDVIDPTMRDLLDLHTKEVMLAMNCHAIAKVQSFDSGAQTITATINYKKTMNQKQSDETYLQVLQDYPIMLDIPVVIYGGGKASLTPPDPTGSDCVILFNDRNIDNWFQGASPGPVASGSLHGFSDGIALIGVNSIANYIENYDTTRFTMRYGSGSTPTVVAVGESLILINNAAGLSLGTILNDLMTALSTFATSSASASTAAEIATAAGVLETSLVTVTSNLEGLLE